MAIKSLPIRSDSSDSKYPLIMESDHCLVLFVGPKKGTIIWSDTAERGYPIGTYSEEWNMNFFYQYNGQVVLKNRE